jgi:hypothetical protein
MKISLLPFEHVRAFADVQTGEIFASNKFVDSDNLSYDIAHELAHITSQDPDHGVKFSSCLEQFGHTLDNTTDTFKKYRKALGIPVQIAANIGNVSGIQNILTDYHLLQAYRKFSQKVLGTEGHWEVINEVEGTGAGDSLSAKDQLIRLYPTPKGAFPVVVLYLPVINHFRSPQARQLTYDLMLAEARIALGSARRKINGLPTPDGGSINYDGSDLVSEGEEAKKSIVEQAIALGEPMGFWLWSLFPLMFTLGCF